MNGTTEPLPKKMDAASAAAIAKHVNGKAAKAKPAARKAKAAPKSKPKAKRGDGPSGRVADILKLASRPRGASRDELNALTKWKGAPWKWLFKNPKGNGYCDRWNYTLRITEGKEGESRYCVTKR